jgi:hypothetical protein
VSLEQPFQGTDLRAAVLSTFGDVQLSGEWQDRSTTRLGLKTSVAATNVCGDAQAITIPVDVITDTTDGRVASLSGPGTVRATVQAGVLTQLALWSSTNLQCRSEADTLAYRSADCLSVAEVTAQLGFNEYLEGTGTNGGRLELYVKDRNSAAAPGAADRVDRLSLTR